MKIFKGGVDCVLYLIILGIFPLIPCIFSVMDKNIDFCNAAALLIIGIMYDCYSRMRDDLDRKDRILIVSIFSSAVFLLLADIVMICLIKNNIVVPDWYLFFFLPVCIPLAISVVCAVLYGCRYINMKRKGVM